MLTSSATRGKIDVLILMVIIIVKKIVLGKAIHHFSAERKLIKINVGLKNVSLMEKEIENIPWKLSCILSSRSNEFVVDQA